MKKTIVAIVALSTALVAGQPERPASNGETLITPAEYYWLANQLPLVRVPPQPIGCESGKHVKADLKVWEMLINDATKLRSRINSQENRHYGERGLITRITLDQFDESTIFLNGKYQLCVGERYKFLEKHK